MHQSTGVTLLGRRYMPPRPDAGCVAIAPMSTLAIFIDAIVAFLI
jgi:hypothetical protein